MKDYYCVLELETKDWVNFFSFFVTGSLWSKLQTNKRIKEITVVAHWHVGRVLKHMLAKYYKNEVNQEIKQPAKPSSEYFKLESVCKIGV